MPYLLQSIDNDLYSVMATPLFLHRGRIACNAESAVIAKAHDTQQINRPTEICRVS